MGSGTPEVENVVPEKMASLCRKTASTVESANIEASNEPLLPKNV